VNNEVMADATPIHPGTRIGHVHLKVSDLQRALDFYCGVLGFELTQRYGRQAAFISAGGYHHHIGLNTWPGKAKAARHRPPTLQAFTIWPSSIRHEQRWPTPCAA
jgi:catechol 2,3-dioxygenase